MWSKYPKNKPEQSGYYYTYYFNNEKENYFYKAIWYDHKKDKWIGWRKGIEPEVRGYVSKTYSKYYIPCLDLVTDDIPIFNEVIME